MSTGKSKKNDPLEDAQFEISRIVKHKAVKGGYEFYVEWKGFGRDEDCWVRQKDMNCPDILEAYFDSIKGDDKTKTPAKPKAPSAKTPAAKAKTSAAKTPSAKAVKEVSASPSKCVPKTPTTKAAKTKVSPSNTAKTPSTKALKSKSSPSKTSTAKTPSAKTPSAKTPSAKSTKKVKASPLKEATTKTPAAKASTSKTPAKAKATPSVTASTKKSLVKSVSTTKLPIITARKPTSYQKAEATPSAATFSKKKALSSSSIPRSVKSTNKRKVEASIDETPKRRKTVKAKLVIEDDGEESSRSVVSLPLPPAPLKSSLKPGIIRTVEEQSDDDDNESHDGSQEIASASIEVMDDDAPSADQPNNRCVIS